MLEINKEKLLMFEDVNRAKILKYIALGLIRYKGDSLWKTKQLSKN